MDDDLATLIRLLPPPAAPDDNHGDWQAVEAELGTPLPDDYKAFIELFGTGRNPQRRVGATSLWVLNPFSRNKFKRHRGRRYEGFRATFERMAVRPRMSTTSKCSQWVSF